MLNQFLISLTLAAHALGLTLPQVIEEGVYVVPTLLTGQPVLVQDTPATQDTTQLDWRILPAVSQAVSQQTEEVSPVIHRFLPLNENRIQPPYKVGTSTGPSVTARSAVLVDVDTGKVLWQKNPDTVRSIASLTKLMTALVYLKHQPVEGMNHIHTLAPEENAVVGYNLTFPSGAQLATGSLFSAMLVGSLNNTALALNGATGLSRTDFVQRMNDLADQFGMSHTTFVDQTGVNNKNLSTAGDVALLAKQAFAETDISQFAQIESVEIQDVTGEIMRTVQATNQLAGNTDIELQGAKTGTTDEAGYCYVFQVKVEGHSVIGVILGATSDEHRFNDALTLIEWTSGEFDWK